MTNATRIHTLSGIACAMGIMLSAVLTASPVSAALLQFSFQGDINSVGGALQPTLDRTHKLSGSFTIESTTAGTPAGANTTQYTNIFKNMTLSLGPLGGPAVMTAALGSADNSLTVKTTGGSLVQYTALGPLTGSSINSRFPVSFEFDGNANTSSPPGIGSFISNEWRIVFSGNGNPKVIGTLTSLTAVPLPAAVILFGAGLVALAGLGAGSRKQHARLS